jgi:type II secretory pathway pseudopilin PulG
MNYREAVLSRNLTRASASIQEGPDYQSVRHYLPVRAIGPRRRQRDGGYLLLAILLMMALMIIAATIEAPRMVQQMKRDREEEMVHRGTEYARAIKKFYKKFGQYPTSLEQLDNTNQIRFLRKRYKDPLAKDGKWTLLHYGDIQALANPNAPGTPAASLNSQGQAGQAGSVVGSAGLGSTQSNVQYTNGPSSDGSGSTFAGTPTQGAQYTNGPGSDGSGGSFGGGSTGSTAAGSQPGNSLGISPFANSVNGQTGPPGSPTGNAFGQNSAGGNQTFGGGAIVGVASLSKDPTIRIYNKKKKYNEWQFIYDPMSDRANVLLRGPYQPLTLGGAQVGTPAGQINGQQQSPFGQQPGTFGQQPGSTPQQTGPGQTGPGSAFPPDQNQPQQ